MFKQINKCLMYPLNYGIYKKLNKYIIKFG